MTQRDLRELRIAAVAAVLALLVLAAPAGAVPFTVNSTLDTDDTMCTTDLGGCTLREAIDDANGNGTAETDQITFTVTGQIFLQTALPMITSKTTITGPGPANLTVTRAVGTDIRIFHLNGANASQGIRIEGMTIANGAPRTTLDILDGGGINVDAGGADVLDNVVVKDNVADEGGGVYVGPGASLDVFRSTIDSNDAVTHGGGIANAGQLTVNSSTIVRNELSGPLAGGGGIWCCEVSTNSTYITNSTIAMNSATYAGGGVYSGNGSLDVESSTIVRNTSDSNNDGLGADDGGGIFVTPAASQTHTGNTILAENNYGTTTPVPNQCGISNPMSSGLTSYGHNLRSTADAECNPFFVATGDLVDPAPLLGPLMPNGGPTETVSPLPGSPAIDAANPAAPAPPPNGLACRNTDQRGLPRGGAAGRCDIGALEVQPAQPVQPVPPAGQPFAFPVSPATVAKKCKKGRKLRKGKCVKKKRRKK